MVCPVVALINNLVANVTVDSIVSVMRWQQLWSGDAAHMGGVPGSKCSEPGLEEEPGAPTLTFH